MTERNAEPNLLQGAEAETSDGARRQKGSKRRGVRRVMVYMPAKVARKFREIAFNEDCQANDVFLAAIDAYLTQQGHGGIKGVIER